MVFQPLGADRALCLVELLAGCWLAAGWLLAGCWLAAGWLTLLVRHRLNIILQTPKIIGDVF
jgi:hypothetical protein